MSSGICITGIGVISAIGHNVAENHMSLVNGFSGITTQSKINTRYAGTLPFGEIMLSDEALKRMLHVSDNSVTRTGLFALHAFRQATADAGLDATQIASSETAFINATTVGGMCMMDDLYRDATGHEPLSPYAASYDCASVTRFVSKAHGMQGIMNTINTACSSSANAIMYGARLIRHGLASRAVVGGVDSLSKFTINGFNALHILSGEACRPFDRDRDGLNLGEGAAFLVLEKEENAGGRKVYARLTGYSNANDAYHPSSLSDNGEGPFLAMQAALEEAQLLPADIDFVNAHGTGTGNNDEAESRAMLRLFGSVPPFVSTKANTGHTLGAAGAIEAVYSIMNIGHQEIYPAVHFSEPITDTQLRPSPVHEKRPIRHVMSNSFGFGGNCSSLIFSIPS